MICLWCRVNRAIAFGRFCFDCLYGTGDAKLQLNMSSYGGIRRLKARDLTRLLK